MSNGDDSRSEDPEDKASEGGFSLGELRKLIRAEIGHATAPPDSERPDPRGAARDLAYERRTDRDSRIASEVAKALGDLRAVEERDRKAAEQEGVIADLKKKVEEKVPRQYTRLQKAMFGKADDDD